MDLYALYVIILLYLQILGNCNKYLYGFFNYNLKIIIILNTNK